MNRCFLVSAWLWVSMALAAGDVLYPNTRPLSQRIAQVLRRPLQQSSFQRQKDTRLVSRMREIDELILFGMKNVKGQHRTLKDHNAHSYGEYFSGKGSSGKGSSGKSKGSFKSEKSKKKGKKEKKKEKKHDHALPSVCEKLDFRSYYSDASDYPGLPQSSYDDYSRKGKAERSRLRRLQFQGPGCDMNVFDVAKDIPSLSTFVSLIEAAYLEDLFLCAGPFSVLAPTNQAFDANPSLTDSLLKVTSIEELREVLLFHVLPGLYLQRDFDEGELTTLQGDSVAISVSPLSIDGSSVDEADVLACNGALQLIDQVLLPRNKPVKDEPEICSKLDFSQDRRLLQPASGSCDSNILNVATQESDLSTFVSLIEAADLSDLLLCPGPFTVFAPSNAAFEMIDAETMNHLLLPENKEKLQNILLYHMIPGLLLSAALTVGSLDSLLEGQELDVTISPITINLRSEVTKADIIACNGNLMIVSDVLVPEPDVCDLFAFSDDRRSLLSFADARRRLTDGVCAPNVFEVAQKEPSISLTLTMLDRVDLSDIFLCNGPFTALLPSNQAWSMLDPSYLEFLLRPENEELLEDLLMYHILPGILTSSSDVDGTSATLLPGETVDVGTVVFTFNGSLTSKRDIEACNGVLHLLENVLLPFALPTGSPVAAPVAPPTSLDTPVTSPVTAPSPTTFPTVHVRDLSPTPTRVRGFCDDFTFDDEQTSNSQLINNIQSPEVPSGCSPNIVQVASSMDDLSLVSILIERAGLGPIFDCPGPFTVQLPTNDAIERLDGDLLQYLLQPQNIEELRSLMLYHVVPGLYSTMDLPAGPLATLSNGRTVDARVVPPGFNDIDVVTGNIEACNGLIHKIDGVLRLQGNEITDAPTLEPTRSPNLDPTTTSPTRIPMTNSPTARLTLRPTPPKGSPTVSPTISPSNSPTAGSTNDPTLAATLEPTAGPTVMPTLRPTPPKGSPTVGPTTAVPTESPSATPSSLADEPSLSPSLEPSALDTLIPTPAGTPNPTGGTPNPTTAGTTNPTTTGTTNPTIAGTANPTTAGTANPTAAGTANSTSTPTTGGTLSPTASKETTDAPSVLAQPTPAPTLSIKPSGANVTTPVPSTSSAPSISSAPSGLTNSTNSTVVPSMSAAPSASAMPSLSNSSNSTSNTTAPSVSPSSQIVGGDSQNVTRPTAAPTVSSQKRIRVPDFYLAYVAGGAQSEPTEDQYAQMVNLTMDYFDDFLTKRFANSSDVKFLGIEPSLDFTLFGEKAGIPNERFNIYMDYRYADVIYTPESNPPNAAETFVILRDSISPEYILDYVRAASGTPFVTTNEVVFRASTLENPNDRSTQRGPRSGETTTSSSGSITALVASSAVTFVFLVAGVAIYRRRSWNDYNYPKEYTDGLYVMDSKMIEGYFSENSVTEMSESQYSSRFPPLQRVAEEVNPTDDDPLQRKAPYRD